MLTFSYMTVSHSDACCSDRLKENKQQVIWTLDGGDAAAALSLQMYITL